MGEQNYRNHRRYVFTYHVLTGLAIGALLFGTIRNLIHTNRDNLYSASLLVLVAFILLSLYIHSRAFANRVQDRAIRAEEAFRYFILTGKLLDARLNIKQIAALRFASDDEFPALAQRAADNNLTSDRIKKEIKHWRADWHRV